MTSTAICCCCTAISPSADYDECSGTWSAGTEVNGVLTSSNNAKILFLRELTSQPWRAVVTVKVKTSGAGATWEVRLIGGNEDPGTGFCDGNGVYLTWGYDADGEYFVLHDTRYPFDTTDCGTPIAAGSQTTTRTLQLCWDGATLTGSWIGIAVGKFLAASQSITPPGTRFGFATGTLDANVVSVEFYDFNLYYVPDGLGSRSRCESCPPDHCCLGPVPAELIFEVSGFNSEALGMVIDPTLCHANCTDISGTFYVAAAQGASIDCGGGLTCLWIGGPYTESAPCDPFMGFPTANQTWFWYITVEITSDGSGNRMILVTIYSYNLSTITIVRLYALTNDPCVDWTSWINLTKYDGTCDLGIYGVARIKAA